MTDKERIEETVKRILPMVWDDKLGFDDVGQKIIGLIMDEIGVRQDFVFLHEREMDRAGKEKDLWAKRFEECFDRSSAILSSHTELLDYCKNAKADSTIWWLGLSEAINKAEKLYDDRKGI